MAKGEICTVEGCMSEVLAKGLCSRHYRQYKRNGEVTKIEESVKNKDQVCQVKGCSNPAKSRGLCNGCYLKWMRKKQKEEKRKEEIERIKKKVNESK